MVELFTYYTNLPKGINEMVAPCYDGYTIYIDRRLSKEGQHKALCHAMKHIINKDFHKSDVSSIENTAHESIKGEHYDD